MTSLSIYVKSCALYTALACHLYWLLEWKWVHLSLIKEYAWKTRCPNSVPAINYLCYANWVVPAQYRWTDSLQTTLQAEISCETKTELSLNQKRREGQILIFWIFNFLMSMPLDIKGKSTNFILLTKIILFIFRKSYASLIFIYLWVLSKLKLHFWVKYIL